MSKAAPQELVFTLFEISDNSQEVHIHITVSKDEEWLAVHGLENEEEKNRQWEHSIAAGSAIAAKWGVGKETRKK